MDVTSLDPTIQRLLQAGLAPSTQRTYGAGKKKYLGFCQQAGLAPLPATEQRLMQFIAYAVNHGLKHQTIKSYISAIRHLQVSCGGGDPKIGDMPQVSLMLRGVRKEQAGIPTRPRLPITPAILRKLRQVWSRDATSWDSIMLWAACCLGFFGFLRSGELTAPEVGAFDAGQHLSYADIAADDKVNPKRLLVSIKQSKTDPFRQGVTISLGRTDAELCPVAALLAYLAIRGQGEGPLFYFKDGRALTRSRLVAELRKVLEVCSLRPQDYSGHSFRIGAATTAAACGVPAETIMTLGRWKSQAYRLYVRLPREQLTGVSRTMATCRL